ncbi:hypothetical protein DBV14_09980 [Variovorax sp. KBW07]|uniref:hypothetical protein n=1 Tax=Variovorax sp. KBW07 TaxID=2153358 RepID=UPI000F585BBE|nr:hypothetical protein [Variovorax sp. KBW07]RQO56820.1 hypothetical protein DBV14_09980 [Variovorax sp. KBW07]
MAPLQRITSRWFWLWISLVSIVLSGCAVDLTTSSKKVPPEMRRIYVQTVEGDGYNVDRIIADQLKSRGYTVVVGAAAKPSEPMDVILTYDDQWSWDITPYLLKLTIKARDAKSGKLISVGEVRRTSMARKSPDEMADELLNELFTKTGKKSGS